MFASAGYIKERVEVNIEGEKERVTMNEEATISLKNSVAMRTSDVRKFSQGLKRLKENENKNSAENPSPTFFSSQPTPQLDPGP